MVSVTHSSIVAAKRLNKFCGKCVINAQFDLIFISLSTKFKTRNWMWCMNRSVYIKIDYAVGGCNALNVQTRSGLQINSNEGSVNVVLNDMYNKIF